MGNRVEKKSDIEPALGEFERLAATQGVGTLHIDLDHSENGGLATVNIVIKTTDNGVQKTSSRAAMSFSDVGALIEELTAWRSRVRAYTRQEKCGCLIDSCDEVTPPCELEIDHYGQHQFTDKNGITKWPAGSGVQICPAKSPATGKRCALRRHHVGIDHMTTEPGDRSWPFVAEKQQRRVATVTDPGRHYPTINECNDSDLMLWPSTLVRKYANYKNWGNWKPLVGTSGFVVSELGPHLTDYTKLYLVDFGENHYAVFDEHGIEISEEKKGKVSDEVKVEIVGWIWRSRTTGMFFGKRGWEKTRRAAGIFPTREEAHATRKLGASSVVLKRIVRKCRVAEKFKDDVTSGKSEKLHDDGRR